MGGLRSIFRMLSNISSPSALFYPMIYDTGVYSIPLVSPRQNFKFPIFFFLVIHQKLDLVICRHFDVLICETSIQSHSFLK